MNAVWFIWILFSVALGPGGWLSYVTEEDHWSKPETRPSCVQKVIVLILVGPLGWVGLSGWISVTIIRYTLYPLAYSMWRAIGP